MTESANPEARIFVVETQFQKMARRAGGIAREQAIEKAQAEIDQIKPEFDDWLDRELRDLIANARTGDGTADWIATTNFRSRQLRDTGTTMGYELLSFIADSFCDLLDSIADGGECNMDAIVCHTDAMMLSLQDAYRHLRPDQVPELTKGLQRVAKRPGTQSPPLPAGPPQETSRRNGD